jgi:hypothetical protein
MRIRRRTAVVLAVAAAGALTVTGFAVANTASNGNVSSVKFNFSPLKLPKKKFHKGALTLGTKTVFNPALSTDNGGDTKRVQLWIDDDIKLNVNSVPKCNPSSFNSNTTMAQAMAACGRAKVGQGIAHSANTAGNIPGCVLVFNGTNNRVILYSRLFTSNFTCANPSSNNGGAVTVTLFGKLKRAFGDFGTQLDVQNIDQLTPAPLGDFTAHIKRGGYVKARCHDRNHRLNVKGKHTYTDNVTSVDKVSRKCKVS